MRYAVPTINNIYVGHVNPEASVQNAKISLCIYLYTRSKACIDSSSGILRENFESNELYEVEKKGNFLEYLDKYSRG